jgi:uncharacterized protein (DUF983 family)
MGALETNPVKPTVMMLRALTRRCPRCGQGRLFKSWFRIHYRCPRCNLVLERGEGAFLGSLSLNYGLTGAVFIVVFVVWLVLDLPDVAFVPLITTSVAVCVIVPVLFFPFAKTIWAAIDLMLHSNDPDYDPNRPKGSG